MNKFWDSMVMESMRETDAGPELIQVAVDVCDALRVSAIIFDEYQAGPGGSNRREISFSEVFSAVSVGVRENSKRVAELEQKRRENSEGVYPDGDDFDFERDIVWRHEMR